LPISLPQEAVGQWLTQLASGGRLVLDEVEWIRTDEPVLEEYLGIATALIAQHGGNMFAGPHLAAVSLAGAATVRLSEVAVVPVPVAFAPRMFRLNLGVWGTDRWIVDRYGAGAIDSLDAQLGALSASPRPAGMTWGMRHLLLERVSEAVKMSFRSAAGRPQRLQVKRAACNATHAVVVRGPAALPKSLDANALRGTACSDRASSGCLCFD
jgi:hypothetical protein